MRRFFFDQSHQLATHTTITLTERVYHHWCNVLRAKVGDKGVLFDGTGGEYTVTLTDMNKKSAQAYIEQVNPVNRALPYTVTLGLVMSRGERMDYAVQKATELGVSQIQLLTSQYGEVRLKPEQAAKKLAHWQQVAISACEQCGLNLVPTLLPPLALNDWLMTKIEQKEAEQKNDPQTLALVLAVPPANYRPNDETSVLPSSTQTLARIHQAMHQATNAGKKMNICLLIGPEGGLSDLEVDLAMTQGFLPWQIGERVLRTETAPVVALTALQTIFALNPEIVT